MIIWIIFAILFLLGMSAGMSLGFLKGNLLAAVLGTVAVVSHVGLMVIEFPIGMAIGSTLAGIGKLLRKS